MAGRRANDFYLSERAVEGQTFPTEELLVFLTVWKQDRAHGTRSRRWERVQLVASFKKGKQDNPGSHCAVKAMATLK